METNTEMHTLSKALNGIVLPYLTTMYIVYSGNKGSIVIGLYGCVVNFHWFIFTAGCSCH